MPTREEMIAALVAPQEPTREEMIASLTNAPQGSGEEEIVNEQYAPIQGTDRAIIKNLSGDREGVMNYLHQKHKGSEFKFDDSGEVLGRDRGTNQWKRMDVESSLFSPSTWELQDLTDIGTDIVGGIADTAAGAGGAILGSAVGPAGTIGGAMAGAGASGAATEALKQKLAQYVGTRQGDISGKEVAMSGGVSGLFAPVAGVGKLGKVGEKVLAKYAGDTAKQQAITKSIKFLEDGMLKRGIQKSLSKTGAGALEAGSRLATGEDSKYLKTFIENNLDNYELKDMINMSESVQKQLEDAPRKAFTEATEIYNSLKGTGRSVDVSATIPSLNTIAEEELSGVSKNIENLAYDKINKIIEANTGGTRLNDVPLDVAIRLEKTFSQYYNRFPSGDVTEDAVNAYVKEILNKSGKYIEEAIDTTLSSDKKYSRAKSLWRSGKELEKEIYEVSKSGKKMFDLMSGIDSSAPGKKYDVVKMKDLANKFGVDFEGTAEKVRAFNLWKNPSVLPASGSSYTILRGMAGAALGSGGGTAQALGAAGGAMLLGSPKLVKQYARGGAGLGNIGRNTATRLNRVPEIARRASWNALRNKEQYKEQE